MAEKKKRRFGRIRKLPSGCYQARYPGPDGIDRPAPDTFATQKDAERWLVLMEAEILAGDWIDPDAGKIGFADYARSWIDERPNLRPRTVELYDYLFRLHLKPTFGGQETSPERPVLTVPQVYAVADVIEPRFRALVLLATFGSLRWGELTALLRKDLDLEVGTVRVERQLIRIPGQGLVFTPPKSAAGKRTVVIPKLIIKDLRDHLRDFAQDGDEGLLFVGPDDGPLWNSNFNHRFWSKALAKAGLPKIHFHDLRHTGNTLAASTGASLRELMDRMGHSSTRAAITYQHATDERRHQVAKQLDSLARGHLKNGSGTQRAHKSDKAE
jgi:integrase